MEQMKKYSIFISDLELSSSLYLHRCLILAALRPLTGKKMLSREEDERQLRIGKISHEIRLSRWDYIIQRTALAKDMFYTTFPRKGFSMRALTQEANIMSLFSHRNKVFVSTELGVVKVRFLFFTSYLNPVTNPFHPVIHKLDYKTSKECFSCTDNVRTLEEERGGGRRV